jgi:hypothetical protein
MDKTTRIFFAATVLAATFGWWATHSDHSPFIPHEKPRPVLKFLSKIAKFGLWFALAAEKAPLKEEHDPSQDAIGSIVKYDEQGNRILNHEGGW